MTNKYLRVKKILQGIGVRVESCFLISTSRHFIDPYQSIDSHLQIYYGIMNNNYYGSIERSDATADLEEAQQSLLGMNVKNNDEGAESRQLSYSRCVYALLIFIMTVASIPAWTTSDERDYLFHNEYSLLQSSVTFAADEGTEIPFPHVDRSQFGKKPVPASSIVDPQLFSSSLRGHGENSSSLLKVPFPTGAFWTNLVMEPTADLLLSYPIIAYPYGFKWNPNMLQVSLPSLRRLMDSVSIRDIFNADLTLSSMENVSQRFIQYFDPLSVTLRFQSSDDILWETFIVQGSPYVTARYENMTPKIQALSIFQGISCLRNNYCTNLSHENERDGGYNTKQLQGTRFAIQTKENLTWLLFTSVPVTLVFDKISRTTILFKEEFSGILRLALIPPVQDELIEFTNKFPQTYENNFDPFSTGISKLIDHSNVYPVGSEISWSFPSDNIGNLLFQYKTKSMTDSSGEKKDEDLLMLALPHHIDVLSSRTSKLMSADDFDLVYNTIKGYMTAVIGSVWSLNEELTSIGFDNDIALEQVSKLSKKTKITILDQVTLDAKVVLPTMDENIYGYGKQVSRLAQLIHISNVLLQGDESLSNKYESVVQAAQDKLHNFLTAFLSGKTIDSLVYDVNFGGLVTKDGLDDFMNDFGNGWYNDHHFHYGYYLYACALMGRWNSTFVSEYGHIVDSVMFDVAQNSHMSSENIDEKHGAFFPLARHKSWFDGHSFASGLFPFASGKSMESSSESINCYYGAYLWSTVRQRSKTYFNQLNFARLLLAMEIRGVKKYWHMISNDSARSDDNERLFNPIFAKPLMVGNLGMLDATVSTWFGNNPVYVHMINFMPVTAITRELFDKKYLKDEFNDVIKPLYNSVEMAWKGYVICDRAMVEPNKAWEDALDLRSYELDQAVSKSQVLYFISTSDSFDISGKEEDAETSITDEYSSTENDDASIFCIDHTSCVDLKLTGMCCPPTPGGTNLNCCNDVAVGSIVVKVDIEAGIKEKTSKDSDNPMCADNTGCNALKLTGTCCPSLPGGTNLACCG